MASNDERIGLWLIGAHGSVGCTVALGLAALRKKLATATGLVTEQSPFRTAGLMDPRLLVIGGHEIRRDSFLGGVQRLHDRAGLFDRTLLDACAGELAKDDRRVRPGTLIGSTAPIRKLAAGSNRPSDPSPAAAIRRLSRDIHLFRTRNRLDRVVVMNIASSEPQARPHVALGQYARMQKELARRGSQRLPTGAVYALAAIEAGAAFVNFTPSPALGIPAVRERADRLRLPYMGSDGKTGETLVKSVLAPMFAMRNLKVLSWFGQNILGNRDGAVLTDPATRESKLRTKNALVPRILGAATEAHVGINYVPSLDDWKIAWDFVHFEGFLGTRMNMQFVWQGADSVLAAPLIIDLARFADRELRTGNSGPMKHLAFYFKDPLDVGEHDLCSQWRRLVDHVAPGRPRIFPRAAGGRSASDAAARPVRRGRR